MKIEDIEIGKKYWIEFGGAILAVKVLAKADTEDRIVARYTWPAVLLWGLTRKLETRHFISAK